MGYYPLFASVAESGLLTNAMVNKNALQQVLNTELVEVMSIVEWKKAEETLQYENNNRQSI